MAARFGVIPASQQRTVSSPYRSPVSYHMVCVVLHCSHHALLVIFHTNLEADHDVPASKTELTLRIQHE